jgi:hypothetical protein
MALSSGLLLSMSLTSTAYAQVCFSGTSSAPVQWVWSPGVLRASRLNEKADSSDQATAFVFWSAGYLHKVAPYSALGVALKLTADSDGHRYGPVLRYRR